jgi:tRNA pseudouridine38-40 synthase
MRPRSARPRRASIFPETAVEVHNHIRGLSPFPGAWFELEIGGKPERIKVLSSVVETAGGEIGTALFDDLTIACGDGFRAADPAAEGWRQGAECRGLPARHAHSCRHKAVLMPRFRLLIEYDGSNYVGWQRQDNGPSVQGAVEKAILALTREPALIRGAGRTDSGVHAWGQVAHVDLSRAWKPETLRNALNAYLGRAGQQVSIVEAAEVPDDFDARFSALRRHYLYRIISRPSPLALEAKRAWWVSKPLDHDAMHAAAQMLVGYHDFTTFRSTHCQANSPWRTLDRLDVTRDGDVIEIRATAQSFPAQPDPLFRRHAENGGRRALDAG